MSREELNEESITAWLAERPGWKRDGQALLKEYRFESFRDAVVFVNRVASVADETGHHPDIDIRSETVRVRVHTPGAGAPTRRDLELAARIDTATPRR